MLEGFDDGAWTDVIGTGGTVTASATYGKNGNGVRLGDNHSNYITVPNFNLASGNPAAGFIIGFAVSIQSAASTQCVARFKSTYPPELRWDPSGSQFELWAYGGTSPDINVAGPVVTGSDWHYHEIKFIHGTSSNGTFVWYQNGSLVSSNTSYDFQSSDPYSFVLLGGTGSSDIDSAYYDDIYISDLTGDNNDFLGPIEVVTLLPNGNGNTSGMTGSDSNSTDNYLLVDENPPDDDTTYVGSATEGTKDTYAFGDLTGTPTVVGLTTRMTAKKTATGAKFLRPVVRSSSTDYAGTSSGLAETYGSYDVAWDVDPATSSAWAYTAVNSAEFGAEVRDS
jgi:hypothetical protein